MPHTTLESAPRARRRLVIQLPTEVWDALHKRIPEASAERIDALTKVVWGFLSAQQSGVYQRAEAIVNKLEDEIAMLLAASPEEQEVVGPGKGLGPSVTLAEGERRLAEFARTRPLKDWAGKVATAGELSDKLGIPRTTLSAWRKQNLVVGLKRDMRNYVYPLEQFIDRRPIDGINRVLISAPNVRAAWLWMRQAHAGLDGGRPIDALHDGFADKVALLAARDFT